jgi:hypothetical protein
VVGKNGTDVCSIPNCALSVFNLNLLYAILIILVLKSYFGANLTF